MSDLAVQVSPPHPLPDVNATSARAAAGRCLLCGADSGRVVWRAPDHTALLCGCGVAFMDPLPERAAIDPTRENHGQGYYAYSAATRLRWVRRFRRAGRLLEVGCGEGHFLAAARRAGFEVEGVDPNPECVRLAAERHGLHVEQACIEDSALPEGRYDVVFHVDLLSHFHDPLRALDAMSRRLRPGGLLCLEVGVLAGFSPAWYRWTGMPEYPDHLWLFSRPAVHALLEKAGFEVVATRRYGLLAGVAILAARRLVRPLLGSWERSARAETAPGTRPSRLRAAYDRFQHLCRYTLGRWMPDAGPQTLFVTARRRGDAEGAAAAPARPRGVHFVVNLGDLLPRYYAHVLDALSARGCRVATYAPEFDGERGSPASAVERHPVPFRRAAPGPVRLARGLAHGWRIGRADPGGVFVLMTLLPHLLYGVPLRLLRRRVIFLMAGMGTMFSSSRPRHRALRRIGIPLYRWLYSGAGSRVVVQNHDDLALVTGLLRAAPEKAFVMPGCGVDPVRFPFHADLPANPVPVVLVPARVVREKGIVEAVSASALLRERGVEHEMWFTHGIDPGNPLALAHGELDTLARANPQVRFLGWQPEIEPLFARCDVVCLPTYREGLPSTLLEGAASGRPLVATDVEGCREVVIDGETGLLVPPRDARALAAALQRLLADPALGERLRRNAWARVRERFTRERSAAAILQAFDSLDLDGAHA